MTENPKQQAWLYIRLSQAHAGSDDSLQAQEAKLRQRADAEGLAVTQVMSEGAGRSAYGGKARPVWEKLIEAVEPGVVVMAVETSRFSRDTADGLTQLRMITNAGGHVLTLDGNDSRQHGNALPLTVRLAVAQEESQMKSDRVLRRKADQRARGIWTNRAPYGHVRRADGKLELEPTTAAVLRRICTEAMNGVGLAAIVAGLTADGIEGPRKNGWTAETVSSMMRSPVICGWMPAHKDRFNHAVHDGAPVVVVVGPTILTVAERQRLRQTMTARSPKTLDGKRVGGRPSVGLLNGLLICGRCGEHLALNGLYYKCRRRSTNIECPGMTITRQLVDDAAAGMVFTRLAALDPTDANDLAELVRVMSLWSPQTDDVAAADAVAELEATQQRLKTLEHDHYVAGTIPADRFTELHAALADRVTKLDASLGEMTTAVDVGPLLDTVQSAEAWADASVPTQQALLRAVVESFTLTPAAKRGVRFSAERLQAAWR